VDLPQAGAQLTQFQKMGEIESVKAVSDLYAPVSGDVIATNHAVVERPELVNSDPYGDGWLLEVRLASEAQLDALLPAEEYDAMTAAERSNGKA
jgi:glycine cleavage system H protein